MTTTKAAASSVGDNSDAKRKRSPRYPIVAIDEALSRARRIYDADRRAFATFESIVEHMGYKAKEKKGGRSARMVATLNQYGLLEKKPGQFRISDMAFRILELPDDSPERAQLIRQAALSPSIISKILRHYEGQIPSDTTLRSHLVLEEEFNPDSAEEFIKVLRRTIQVANLSEADYNAGEEPNGEPTLPPAGGTPRVEQQIPGRAGQTPPPPKPPAGQRPYPLYLSQEREAVLYVPTVMSQTEYDLLKSQIENSLLVMKATSVVPDPKPNEQKAEESQ